MRKLLFFAGISAFVWAVYSCKHDAPLSLARVSVDTSMVSFEDQIQPILNSNCNMSGCHDANSAKEGVDLSTYKAIAGNDDLLKAGKPDNSSIYTVLGSSGKGKMPPAPRSLTSDQIALIRRWIVEGAKNSFWLVKPCVSTKYTYNDGVKAIYDLNCAGCHNSPATSGGNIVLGDFNAMKTIDSSTLIQSIMQTGTNPMPPAPASKLSDCEITVFKNWYSAGQPQN